MFERGCAIPAWGLVGKGSGPPQSQDTATGGCKTFPLRPGLSLVGGRSECPAEIIVPLVGGQGNATRWSIRTATQNFAPSHSLFLNNLKLQSHLEKRNMDLDSKRIISLCAFCFLPPAPQPPLPNRYVEYPLPSVLVSLCPLTPDGKGGWWKGMGDAGLGACLGLATGTPVSVSPAPQSVCPCAHGCPRVLGCTRKHRGMLLWLPLTPAWLLASPLRLPPPWKAQPTLLLGQTEAPLVFLPPLCSIQLTAL